jgi:hypothetical protein
MSKLKAIIAAALIGMYLLNGGVYPAISHPVSQQVAQVTPTPGPNAPPACGGNSCGG